MKRFAAARQPLNEGQREARVGEFRQRVPPAPWSAIAPPSALRRDQAWVVRLRKDDEDRERVVEAYLRMRGCRRFDHPHVAGCERALKQTVAVRCAVTTHVRRAPG
jgi:hypothetical protein